MTDLIAAGDDYELVFTLPPDRADELKARLGQDDPPVQPIGEITESAGVVVRDADGSPVELAKTGWRHR